ncbi:MAG: aminoacyl-tRNA hydrolase [Bacteroidetes bacterium]|nr:aminoacyl-tRNA hydrolase [Bacteroidota bacterium]
MSVFLIVGIGNIGPEYAGTRHNIGFDIADALVQKHGGSFTLERLASVSEIKWKGATLICIKPTTYVNLSGRAIKYWMDKKKISVERILVIADDIALPITKLRLRPTGSDAGHNGLKSVQEALNTTAYPRLRFGVGNDFPKGRQVDYVLGRWNQLEFPLVKLKIEKSVELIESFVTMGIEWTMNQYNKLEITL